MLQLSDSAGPPRTALSLLSGPWAPPHANRLAGSCVRVFLACFLHLKSVPRAG